MSKPKPPAPPPQPKAPSPQNEYYYQGSNLTSQRIYDPSKKGYVTTSFEDPNQQAIQKQSTAAINDLITKSQSAANPSPEAIAQYGDAYAAPQIAALNTSYNQAKGSTDMAAHGSGMANSVGFSNYMANQIEKNRAQGLADIQSNKYQQELDLPNKMLMPYANQLNMLNSAISGTQSSVAQNLEPAFQGSQAGSNAANQSFQNQANSLNQGYQNQLNYYNSTPRGGLFSFFSGGA